MRRLTLACLLLAGCSTGPVMHDRNGLYVIDIRAEDYVTINKTWTQHVGVLKGLAYPVFAWTQVSEDETSKECTLHVPAPEKQLEPTERELMLWGHELYHCYARGWH
jgi:hypothetical protein